MSIEDQADKLHILKQSSLKPLLFLLPLLRPYMVWVFIAAISLIISSFTFLSIGWWLRQLIDQGFVANDLQLFDSVLMVLVGMVVVLSLSTFGRFYAVSYLGERVIADLRLLVYRHFLSFEPSFFEDNRVGELSSRLTTDAVLIETIINSSFSIIARNVIIFSGGVVLLIISSPKLASFMLLLVPIIVGSIIIFGRYVKRFSRRSQAYIGEVAQHITESLRAVGTIQAFNQEDHNMNSFRFLVQKVFAASMLRIRARAFLVIFVILNAFGTVGLLLWVGGKDVLLGNMTPGELSSFVFYAIVVAGALGAISEFISDLQRAAGASERITELLKMKPKIVAPSLVKTLAVSSVHKLSFNSINFSYPSRPHHLAIENFSWDIRAGEKVAIVGPSGSGKSTLFNLILRFYDPISGSICLDDVDIRTLSPKYLRQFMSIVPQDPTLFATSILENIRFGNTHASDEDVVQVAKKAAANLFIDALSDGYQTQLGERGVRLSGGQCQRIAIARALLKNPSILLLDEATSALDSENESIIQTELLTKSTERMTIVIAHRLSTVVNADHILVMSEGKIVAKGTHESLLRQGGLYTRMVDNQLLGSQLNGIQKSSNPDY